MQKVLILLTLFFYSNLSNADFFAGAEAFNKQDYATALYEFQLLAEQGNADAQYNLGIMYREGLGVDKDYFLAKEMFHKAAVQGLSKAQNNLGMVYRSGQGAPQDYTEAFQWFYKAAEQGNSMSEFNLGLMYFDGLGVSQNYSEAIKWFRKAADKGYAAAQSKLAYIFASGKGVFPNLTVAYALWKVSSLSDPSSAKDIDVNLNILSQKLSLNDLKTGQALADEMAKPGQLLNILDRYLNSIMISN